MAFEEIRRMQARAKGMGERETEMEVMKPTEPGQKSIRFKKGGLHASTGTPMGKKIPAKKKAAARAGKYGPKAKKQAMFAQNVLTGQKG